MVKEAFHRVKVPLAGLFGIVLITLIVFTVAAPEKLRLPKQEGWTITGNAVVDESFFDGKIAVSAPCAPLDDPVCATDGKTYGNLCEARKAGADMGYKGSCGGWERVG